MGALSSLGAPLPHPLHSSTDTQIHTHNVCIRKVLNSVELERLDAGWCLGVESRDPVVWPEPQFTSLTSKPQPQKVPTYFKKQKQLTADSGPDLLILYQVEFFPTLISSFRNLWKQLQRGGVACPRPQSEGWWQR